MSEDDFAVFSKDSDSGELNLDTYEDEGNAEEMAERLNDDMPDRTIYLGASIDHLKEDEK